MPWDEGAIHQRGLKGRENSRIPFGPGAIASRGPSGRKRFCRPVTQGIGLRPQPWAGISRPVGPGFGRSSQASGLPVIVDQRGGPQDVPPREGCRPDQFPHSIALPSLAVRLHEEDRREGSAIRMLWPGSIRGCRGRMGRLYVFPAPRSRPVDVLCAGPAYPGADALGRGVSAPVPSPRPAGSFRADPLLRPVGQPSPGGGSGSLSRAGPGAPQRPCSRT
jgi:hypothetical protein